MKYSSGRFKQRIKLLLLVFAIILALASLYFSQLLVQKIQQREKEIAKLYASSLTYLANSKNVSENFTFIFENIIQRIDFPMIMTDAEDNPIYEKGGAGFRNLSFDSTMTHDEVLIALREKVKELKKESTPIIVYYPEGVVWKKIYFGSSNLVIMLKYFPFAQITFAFIFILIAYMSLNYFRKSEESSIWVGMSKETAHQLGTPISSLMGWNELLKMEYNNPDKVLDISDEISNDLTRLNKIANRFSKIGSKPELKETNLFDMFEEVKRYFDRRFPQMEKSITISIEGNRTVKAKINRDLFEWVLENLIKNARDAISNKQGKITLKIIDAQNSVDIEVSDNGKGISPKQKKEIFKPGFSTKKRGWGLGLSLTKRIIEDYHGGKITLKESSSEGTTFLISLPK